MKFKKKRLSISALAMALALALILAGCSRPAADNGGSPAAKANESAANNSASERGGDDFSSGSRDAVANEPHHETDVALAGTLKDIPDAYLTPAANQGTLTTISYQATDRAGDGSTIAKEAVVYLPSGYDENDTDTRYNILYLLHGWTGVNDTFWHYDDSDALQNVLDNLIANGDIAPLIVVTPTFDRNNESAEQMESVAEVDRFHEELMSELLPAVESQYHTYAQTLDAAGLKASRDHRAFAGFSMGAAATWFVFLNAMDAFKYYMPMSGSCWALEDLAFTPEISAETAEYLANYLTESGLTANDYFVYAAVGSNDVAFDMNNNLMVELVKYPDYFNVGNLVYNINEGGVHWWDAVVKDLYNGIPYLFHPSDRSRITAQADVPMLTLNNGAEIPQLGLGTQIQQLEGDASESGRALLNETSRQSVVAALQAGYRHLDTAHGYNNERGVGQGIIDSGVPREEIWLTSKLWPSEFGEGVTMEAIDKMLERLQTDYIDLIYLHHPAGDYVGAWKDLEEACRQGKVRALGISNFDNRPEAFRAIVEDMEIKPQIMQIECHPYAQRQETRALAEQYGMRVECWYPIGHADPELLNNDVLTEIAANRGKSVVQVILRWHMQEGFLAIPGSTNPDHIQENVNIFDFELSDAEMEQIRALDKGESGRYFNIPYESMEEMFVSMSFG